MPCLLTLLLLLMKAKRIDIFFLHPLPRRRSKQASKWVAVWIVNLCCDDKISDHSTVKWMSTHEFRERVYMIQLKGASNVNDGFTDGEIININRMCSREMPPPHTKSKKSIFECCVKDVDRITIFNGPLTKNFIIIRHRNFLSTRSLSALAEGYESHFVMQWCEHISNILCHWIMKFFTHA